MAQDDWNRGRTARRGGRVGGWIGGSGGGWVDWVRGVVGEDPCTIYAVHARSGETWWDFRGIGDPRQSLHLRAAGKLSRVLGLSVTSCPGLPPVPL